jgi:hypothetical protein
MVQFYRCFYQELCFYHGINHKVNEEDKTFYLDHKVSRSLGSDQTKIYGSTKSDTSKLVVGVPCPHICIFTDSRCNVNTYPNW